MENKLCWQLFATYKKTNMLALWIAHIALFVSSCILSSTAYHPRYIRHWHRWLKWIQFTQTSHYLFTKNFTIFPGRMRRISWTNKSQQRTSRGSWAWWVSWDHVVNVSLMGSESTSINTAIYFTLQHQHKRFDFFFQTQLLAWQKQHDPWLNYSNPGTVIYSTGLKRMLNWNILHNQCNCIQAHLLQNCVAFKHRLAGLLPEVIPAQWGGVGCHSDSF